MKILYTLMICFFVMLFSSCASQKKNGYNSKAPHLLKPELSGISGMSKVDDENYIVIHDTKKQKPNKKDSFPHARLSLLSVENDKWPILQEIRFKVWENTTNRANDLESICKLSKRNNEYLVIEAGSWEGRKGRIYHVKIDVNKREGTVVNEINLPLYHDNALKPVKKTGDQYEGCLCMEQSDGQILLILAERGGSDKYPMGVLRWGVLDLNSSDFKFSNAIGHTINAPGSWLGNNRNRDITDLFLDDQNRIWASAAEDNGEYGSFYSVIYKIGTITNDLLDPIRIETPFYVHRELFGIKVEALAQPSSISNQTFITVGFDDEMMGGGWRNIK